MSGEDFFDVVIVGAGASGGALAGRLTEYSDKRVLLLEAGPVFDSVEALPTILREPGTLSAASPSSPYNWSYPVEMAPGKPTGALPRGKTLGGSTSINGCSFMRGTRSDFDGWAAAGNEEWSFDKVLPIYKRVESDQDFTGEYHGATGPITVSRETPDRAPLYTRAFADACNALGYADDPDKNAPDTAGVGPTPQNIRNGVRCGTALGYLIPAIGRPNYTVIGNAVARRVLFEGTKAVGVEVRIGSELRTFRGDEIVLSAGALRTPQILMLSGVGPADHLTEMGIPVVVDLPGVGQNLTDHASIHAVWKSNEDLPKAVNRSQFTSLLNFDVSGTPMQIMPFVVRIGDMMGASALLERPVEETAAAQGATVEAVSAQREAMRRSIMGITLYKSQSRGQITLRSADPDDFADIRFNLLSEEADRAALRDGVRVAHELFQTGAMREIGAEISNLTATDLQDDSTLDAWVWKNIGAGHPSCSCRMGPSSDRMAVVDQYLRVHGVDNLRVVDTSSFPELTTRGPNATATMLGDRAADFLA